MAPENLTIIGFALIELFGFTMTEPFFFILKRELLISTWQLKNVDSLPTFNGFSGKVKLFL